MKIWINKTIYTDPSDYFSDALVFNMLDENPQSNLKTNLEEIWRRFSKQNIDSLYEDFLVIAVSVFATDKRVSRSDIKVSNIHDNWTRQLEICVPVLNIDKWLLVKETLEEALGFLSGDFWTLSFRQTYERYRNTDYRKKDDQINNDFDCVSLFSGGLDSFSGAIKLLREGKKVCFVGCMEYNTLNNRILELYELLHREYVNVKSNIIVFSTKPGAPVNIDENIKSRYTENTSRSRSLLFIAGALAVASIIGSGTPIFIPENGFIGLNIPLTPSRMGSCSTRTTHVFFLSKLNEVLSLLDIPHKIENFYAYRTKGEIVDEIKDSTTFLEGASRTISCSHPTLGRIDGAAIPINCGYCFPCLIRRASLHKIGYKNDEYLDVYNNEYKLSIDFIKKFKNPDSGRAKDLKATLMALHKYLVNDDADYYKKEMIKLGGLSPSDIDKFNKVYVNSMEEIKNMIISQALANDLLLLDYIGVGVHNV
ncbi:MAG TPA: hypothetical protein DEF36_09960 [Desulfotomaculum sp.]|nr:hypothetical protein [Desulfotomaculum sp.]